MGIFEISQPTSVYSMYFAPVDHILYRSSSIYSNTTENVKLCRCWPQIIEDAIISDSQKSVEFYSKVTDLFLEDHEDPDLNENAVQRQWKKIQAAVS